MIQLACKPSPIPAPSADTVTEEDDIDRLLRQAGSLLQPGQATRALIIADHGIDLLGGLIRRGCTAAAWLRPVSRPETATYQLVFILDITPDSDIVQLIHTARRTLLRCGRLVARVSLEPNGRVTRGLARRLKLNGFVGLRTLALPGRCLLRAELAPSGAAGALSRSPVGSGMAASHRRAS